jgi:nucleotide-binding universal stress UspA family protein
VSLRKQSQTYLDERARGVPGELLEAVRVALGAPWEAVCTAARDEHVDLVVIGSHGYGGVDRLLGTTAAKIVNHADRPVLVVRPVPAPP